MIRFTNFIFISLLLPLILFGLSYSTPRLKKIIKQNLSISTTIPGSESHENYPIFKENPFIVIIHDWTNLSELENLVHAAQEQTYENYRIILLSTVELLPQETHLLNKWINPKLDFTIAQQPSRLSFLPILYMSKDSDILTFLSPRSIFQSKNSLSLLNQLYQSGSTWGTLEPSETPHSFNSTSTSESIISSIRIGCAKIIPLAVLFNSLLKSSQNAIQNVSPLIKTSFNKHLSVSTKQTFFNPQESQNYRNSIAKVINSNSNTFPKIQTTRKFNPINLQSYSADKDLNIVISSRSTPMLLNQKLQEVAIAWEDRFPIFVMYEANSSEIKSRYQGVLLQHPNIISLRITANQPSNRFRGELFARKYTFFLNDQTSIPSLEPLQSCLQFFALTKTAAMLPQEYSFGPGIDLTSTFSMNLPNPPSSMSPKYNAFFHTQHFMDSLTYTTHLPSRDLQSHLSEIIIPPNSILVYTSNLVDKDWKSSLRE